MKYFLFFIFLLISLSVFSQTYSYRHYTIFDGLPQNQVGKIYQDKNGFIWLWTKGGISRFDGKNFKNYFTDQIPNGYIVGFLEFRNKFYICSSRGLAILEKDSFRTLCNFRNLQISYFTTNYDTTELCICTNNKVIKINSNGKLTINTLPEVKIINGISYSRKNISYVYTSDSGLYLSDKENVIKKLANGYCGEIKFKNDVYYFTFPYNPDFLNHEYYGICYFNGKNINRIYNPKSNLLSDAFKILPDNNIIVIQNKSTWIKLDLKGNIIDKDSLPDVAISDLFIDKSNNLWLATETGLYQLQSYAFKNYDEKSGMPKYVWSILADRIDDIVFATFHGKLVQLKNNQLKEIAGYKNMLNPDESFYPNGFCNSLGQWMLPTNRRIIVNDSGHFSSFELIYKNKKSCAMCCYEDTTNKAIYFGTTQGVFKYNLSTKLYNNYYIKNTNVLYVAPDKYNRLWVCTNMGVYLLNNDTIISLNKNEPIFNSGTVSCKRDPKGNMWFAQKNGLYLYDYSKIKKVYDGSFYFISLYKNRYLIAGSTLGFLYIDLEKFYLKDNHSMHFFDRFNGFIGIECGQNGTCIDSKGNVWIPTSESVVKFMPEKLVFDTIAPKTFIYSIEAAKSNWVWKRIASFSENNKNETLLKWNNNNIKVNFHALSYPCSERVIYQYRLIGYDSSWANSQDESIIYTNLKPGEYCFEVKACNENKYWNNIPTMFKFQIVPAFWQTIWFLVVAIVLILFSGALLVYYIMKQRQIREKKQREVEQKLIAMQVSTINAQLDPHFIFNAITAIGSEVQEKNTEKAYAYFVKVSHLLRSSLKDSDKITRTINEEIKFVENYLILQKFRFEERFNYNIVLDKNVNIDTIVPKMCIQIFVENALKHGLEHKLNDGKLFILINKQDNGIVVSIEDNGVGRFFASKYKNNSTGVGLKVFNEFFKIMNNYNTLQAGFKVEDLFTTTGESAGTKVKLFIPDNYRYILQ